MSRIALALAAPFLVLAAASQAQTGAMELGPHRAVYLDETPSWFSDGQRLAFQSNRTGRMEIWTINAHGSDLRQLTGRR